MNCANHADISAVAYCRTCGKPLCANCTRAVRGVIYCENCLATRLEGVLPPAAPGPPLSGTPGPAPLPGSGPNPALAGILAGFFPVGVGAVYTGQYAKGDRKSTRLNSSHLVISYAVFCLKKKKHHLAPSPLLLRPPADRSNPHSVSPSVRSPGGPAGQGLLRPCHCPRRRVDASSLLTNFL